MYHLLVTAQNAAWDFPPYRLPDARRFLEYTDDVLAAQFKDLTDARVLAAIYSAPALFMYEKQLDVPGWAGRVVDVSPAGRGGINILFEVDRSQPITWNDLTPFHYQLEIAEELELNRTHWAIKGRPLDVVLRRTFPERGEFISAFSADRRIMFSPSVFKIPEGPVRDDLVAIMMPFAAEFTPVHNAIKAACASTGHECLRVDNMWEDSAVIQDIFSLIFRARIVVVDFTGKNSNVMYETGIAHTLGKHVVPITQSIDDVPFDMRHHRAARYLPNDQGLAALVETLSQRLTQLRGTF